MEKQYRKYSLSEDKVIQCKKIFTEFTRDNKIKGKYLNQEQTMSLLHNQGISLTQKQLNQMNKAIFNQNDKKQYSIREIITIIGRKNVDQQTQEQIYKIFKFFDIRNCKKLTPIDLKNGFIRLNQKVDNIQIDKIFLDCDLHGDGTIDFEEFLSIMI